MGCVKTEQPGSAAHPRARKTTSEFKDVLSDNLTDGPAKESLHHIKVTCEDLICLPLRKMSPVEPETLKKTLDEFLATEYIRPSASPWGAVCQEKGRFTTDVRRLLCS